MKRNLPLVIIAGVLVVALVAGYFLYRSQQATTSAPFATTQTPATSPIAPPAKVSPESKGNGEVKSPIDVSVLLEEYGDYQCPPCGQLHPELKKIKAEYGPRIDFVFHNLPLPTLHKNAMIAAQAAEAARLQGRFWEMHDYLYEHQNDWKDEENPRATFTKYAQALALDQLRFARDLDAPEVQQHIAQDMQRANSLGVTGTPTILIDGRQLKVEVTTPEGIRKGLNVMLTRKAATP